MENEIYEVQEKPKGFVSLAVRGVIGTTALGITGFVAFAGVSNSADPELSPVQTQAKVLETSVTPEALVTEIAPEPNPSINEETTIISSGPAPETVRSPAASIGTISSISLDDDDEWNEDSDDHEDEDHEEDHERSDNDDDNSDHDDD